MRFCTGRRSRARQRLLDGCVLEQPRAQRSTAHRLDQIARKPLGLEFGQPAARARRNQHDGTDERIGVGGKIGNVARARIDQDRVGVVRCASRTIFAARIANLRDNPSRNTALRESDETLTPASGRSAQACAQHTSPEA